MLNNKKRPGAFAVYISDWDIDILDFLDSKKKNGDDRRRLHGLFIAVNTSTLFIDRDENEENWTLFDPYDVPNLLKDDAYGDKFKEYYEEYEEEFKNDPSRFNENTEVIPAKDLMRKIAMSYGTEGMPFQHFIDNTNNKHKRKELGKIRASNLCFTGDTKIAVADGRNNMTIKELAEESKGKNTFKVYSAKELDNVRKTKAWLTVKSDAVAFKTGTKNIITIKLENKDEFRCTKDHELALVSGGYIKAEDSIGKSLKSFYNHTTSEQGIKVIDIIDNSEIEDVYDLTVPDTNNFYILTSKEDETDMVSQGVLVHNCTEILQGLNEDDTIVCNLGSINLARVNTEEDLTRVTKLAIRALDNSIDLTKYPTEKAKKTQTDRRTIGLGALGEAEMLVNKKIIYGSEEHKVLIDEVYGIIEDVSEETSKELAKEKGSCIIDGVRNAYLRATAPNSTSAIFASTTNSMEAVFDLVWIEENNNVDIKMTAPNIQSDNFNYYVSAYDVDPFTAIDLTAIRYKHVDQGLSHNIFLRPEGLKLSTIRKLIRYACRKGLGTLYYFRTKAPTNKGITKQENKIACVGCAN